MQVITKEQSAARIIHKNGFEVVRDALTAAPVTASFPVVLGHGSNPANRFTVKSGAPPGVAALKVGSYWPGKADRGLPRHHPSVLLLDQDCGGIVAVVKGALVNAYRTAAADAVATNPGAACGRDPGRVRDVEPSSLRGRRAGPRPQPSGGHHRGTFPQETTVLIMTGTGCNAMQRIGELMGVLP